MNPVSQSDLLKALDALILQESETLEEADITISRLVKRAKCGKQKAQSMIDKWLSEKKIEPLGKRREATKGGRMVEAWRVVV